MADHKAVASSVYNLAGPEDVRPDFLKSVLMGGIMQGASLGEAIPDSYLNGPYFKFRRFLKWAKTDADFAAHIGPATGELRGFQVLDLDVVKANTPPPSGMEVDHVELAQIGDADVTFWVLQYLLENHASDGFGTGSDYSFEYDKDAGMVTIDWVDSGKADETFFPVGFESGAQYLYVRFIPAFPEVSGPVTWDASYATSSSPPDLTGYTQDSQTTGLYTATVNVKKTIRKVRTSDNVEISLTSTVTPSDMSVGTSNTKYYKDVYKGKGPGGANSVYSERHWIELDLTYTLGAYGITDVDNILSTEGGVAYMYTVTTETQSFDPVYRTKGGLSEVTHREWEPPRYFIYGEASGDPELDALFTSGSSSSLGSFYPSIPFRFENKVVGPAGAGSKEWWVDVGVLLDVSTQFIQVKGGPVQDPDFVEVDILDFDPGAPTVNKIANRPAYGIPLSSLLQSPSARFRILTDGSVTSSGVSEVTEWFPFPSPPTPDANEALDDVYPTAKKAFRKAFGSSFDKVQQTILNNEKIEDIDHVLAVFGVSFNVEELACRKYVYKFFKHLMTVSSVPTATEEDDWYNDPDTGWYAARDSEIAYGMWQAAELTDPGATYADNQPPDRIPFPEIPWQSLRVESVHGGVSDYRTEIKWAFIHEDTGIGQYKPGKKKDDLEFEVLADPIADYRELDEDNPDGFNQKVVLYWQETDASWRSLTFTGLQHVNHVYKDLKVTTTAKKAIETAEESGFIVPLHEDVYESMTLIEQTQMATACAFLVFNCYEVKKEQWYESTWFKVILIAVIIGASIALAVATGPGSLGAGGLAVYGLLTGAGLGATTALILGAIADVLLALLLSYIIGEVSVLVFGEKWGHLIGTILATVLTLGVGAASSGLSVSDLLADPGTWVSLSLATGNGVAGFLNDSAAEVAEATAKMMEETNRKTAEVQRQYNEQFGSGRIDPTLLSKFVSEVNERPGDFLSRTLLTGSDIVELTLRSISSFTADRLRLELI